MFSQEHLRLRLVRLRASEPWRAREGLAFVFPTGGTGTYQCGRLSQRFSTGDAALFSADRTGAQCVSESPELVFWSFSLNLEHLFPLFAANEIALLQTVMAELKGLKLYPAGTEVAGECHRLVQELPPHFDLDHRSQLLRIAASLLSEEFKRARTQRVGYIRAEEHLVQAFEKLSTEQLLRLSVRELAQQFGGSRRHLNRLFHKHFGFSIVGLRMEMRLLKAISLLRDPAAKVLHVAEQSGFNHLGLFNTCFRRRFGTSPSQWRKRAQPGQGVLSELTQNGGQCPLHSHGLCPWQSQLSPGQAVAGFLGSNLNGPASAAAPQRVLPKPEPGPKGLPAEPEPLATETAGKSPAAALLQRCARL